MRRSLLLSVALICANLGASSATAIAQESQGDTGPRSRALGNVCQYGVGRQCTVSMRPAYTPCDCYAGGQLMQGTTLPATSQRNAEPRYTPPPPRFTPPPVVVPAPPPRARLGDICEITESRSGRTCDLRRPLPVNSYCECVSPSGRAREGRVVR